MTAAAVPGGAPAPADPPRPGLRARLSSLQGYETLCLPVGEIRDLVAALDAARADVERLTAQVATLGRRMERMEEPSQHVTWLGPDGEEYHPDWCRECRVDALRADVERLRGRTHEIQAQEMAKRAALDSELAEWRTRHEAAKEWTEEVGLTAEHAAGEWKYSPFWGLTSYNARSALLRLVTDRDEARAEVERLRVNLAHAQNVALANSEWIIAVCAALGASVEIEPPDAAAWVSRLRAVEWRAALVAGPDGTPASLRYDPSPWQAAVTARYILTGTERPDA